jgi:hypothetical protein
LGPTSGQIQRTVDEGVPLGTGVREKDANLAVGDLSRRAAVLGLNPHRLIPFLQEPGLIDHQHGLLIRKMLDHLLPQIIAPGIGVPARRREQPLDPSGDRSPAGSANCQPFFRSAEPKRPVT